MSYIHSKSIYKQFGNGSGKVDVIRGIDFIIKQGEFLSLMGESGAGKSTFLSILGGLLSPSSGEIVIEGIDIYKLKRDKLADFRREFMGFIFQSFQLVSYLNILENVQLPLADTHKTENDKKSWHFQLLSELV